MKYLRLHKIIEDVTAGETVDFERFLFPGGEQHIKITGEVTGHVTIESQITSSADVMALFLATDALERLGVATIDLLIPYVPYARQDRVMVAGEPLSAKVFACLINSHGYNKVYTLDNHSPVSTALIDGCVEIDSSRILGHYLGSENSVLISPDAGAYKRCSDIARRFGMPLVCSSKIRDVKTGKITGTKVDASSVLEGRDVYIVDDICDGGRTFTELAKVLSSRGVKSISLYVSHGIFSKGLSELSSLIGRIYTTNSFGTNVGVRIIPIRKEDLK
jgi:ribose-phosphate pyrophosphokinase